MIPIYRAKREQIKYNEEGLLREKQQSDGTHIAYTINGYIIDTSTLAIHFPDMKDSEGTKIFASLSEDGKGGDICEWNENTSGITFYEKGNIIVSGFYCSSQDNPNDIFSEHHYLKVTEIQE